uniref:Integrase catalytic domain-containing protein n=1 Tax=Fagus sylvatica TaxID=28930 RepID=A0A2N9GEU1_FAGSY
MPRQIIYATNSPSPRSNNNGGKSGGRGNFGPGRGSSSNSQRNHRGRGRGRNNSNRSVCQVCHKPGHAALTCYHRFDNSYTAKSPYIHALYASPNAASDLNWYSDSGATHHLTNDLANLNVCAEEYTGSESIRVGNGKSLPDLDSGKLLVQGASKDRLYPFPASSNKQSPHFALLGERTSLQHCVKTPTIPHPAGVPIGVLNEGLQRLQTQIDEHSGAIEELHAKFDRLEAKVDNGLDNLQAMMRELLQKQPGVEQPAVQPVVEQPAVQPRQEVQTPTRVQGPKPRVGMQMGEFFENGQNEPILGEFGDPIEERRNVRNNARIMPPFQGHFDAPYEEPWLGRRFMPQFQGHFDAPYEEPWLVRRQGRQQGQQGQQAQFEPHASPPRHGMHFGDPREDQWGLNDQDEAWFDPRRGRPARERPRQYQGAHHRDPYWQEQDGPPWNQGRARDLEANEVGLSKGRPMPWPRYKKEYLATMKRSTRPTYEPSQGSWVQSQAQQGAARVENKSGDSKQFSARPSMQVQRLTPMQMSERRKKGLCYNYDERWSSDHKCKDRKLYVMEEVEDEEAELVEIEEEEVEAELEEAKAEITLCALLGSTSPSTMRVITIVNGQTTVVLLDTGSTHNFMDETLAKTLKLPIDGERNFGVRVANGQVIRTLGECKEVKFKMQGLYLKLTFNLLELGGYGIVLGTQWLSTLGMINWDFKNFMMRFMHEGKKVWLQGLKEKPNLIQGSKDFKGKATMKGLLFQIMPCELASIQEEIGAPIRELVEEFPQVLEEPKGLPPKRNHEHQILLKHETSKPAGLLQPLGIPPRPWLSTSMDFVEGLLTSSKQKVFKLHGLLSSIVSNRDTAFTSLFWEELFRRQGVDLALSSSYHPQSDGPTEVVNKSLEHYLRAFAANKPSLGVEWLPFAEYWFNTNYHTSTKLSPFEALYGYLPLRLIEFVPKLTRVAAVEDFLEHEQQVVGLLEHNLKSMCKKLGKLSPKFYEPYKVIQRVGMVAYKLELPDGACIHPVFHVSFLKAKLGKTITPISRLPPTDALGHLAPQPAKILTRTIKKRRLPAVTEVLVQWEGGDPDDATWELLFKLQEDYPHLVGKVF